MKRYDFIKETDENGNETIKVSDKRRRKLDLFPRLICLLIAAVIWLWMVNFNDTDIAETMVLDIKIVGLDTLEDNGMMIYGLDKKEITVTVTGSNRDLKKYGKDQYKVTVDVSGIREVGQHTLPLSIITPDGSSLTLSESEIPNVSFYADEIGIYTVPLTVVTPDILEKGNVKYSYECEFVGEITVKGAKSQLKHVVSARFNVDGSFAQYEDSKTFSGFMPTFYDTNLIPVVVDESAIIECSTDAIEVLVNAFKHKTLDVVVNGEKLVGQSVEIWGAPSLIDTIKNELEISIELGEPGTVTTYTISDKDFPEGVYFKGNTVITIEG